MSFKRLDPEDFLVSVDSVTATAWSTNSPTLTAFFTSSTTSTNDSYYKNVYQTGSTLSGSAVQFAIAYGNKNGSGSAYYNGAVPGFPNEAVMELPAVITSKGAQSIKTKAMRGDIDALVRSVKDFELLTIQAAVHGEEDSALRALITNPIGPDISQARELWADLRKENAGMIGALNG
jgi:6-phospho-beta-glucosidase